MISSGMEAGFGLYLSCSRLIDILCRRQLFDGAMEADGIWDVFKNRASSLLIVQDAIQQKKSNHSTATHHGS